MSPKESPLCLKLLKKEDSWQAKAKKLMQVLKSCYCVQIIYDRECISQDLSDFIFRKKLMPKDYLQHAMASELEELSKDQPDKAPKQLAPVLQTVEMLIEPTAPDCPPFADKEEFFQAIMTVTEAFSRVGRRDIMVSTCATMALQLLKQIIYVDEIFGSNYVSEKASKQSHQPALHIKGKGDDGKGQEESDNEGGGEPDGEEGEEEQQEVQLGLMPDEA